MTRAPAEPRQAAYQILQDTEAGAFADRAAELRLARLAPRDRRFAQQLAYGCIRLRGRLDAELAKLVDRPLQRLERPLHLWLRLGLYQLRETRIPDHAAVSETVAGVRRALGRRAAGFANAVLRTAARQGRTPDAFPSPEQDLPGYLSSYGSHPAWLIERWLQRWPADRVARLVELDNTPPAVVVRLPAGVELDSVGRATGGAVRLVALPEWPGSYRILAGTPNALLAAVPAVVQDPAASAVVDYAVPDPAGPLLDACAAPGAKAIGLAWSRPQARPLVAADASPERLRLVAEAARRTGVAIRCVAMDARQPAVARARTVVIDAPCTGTGVLRRRPDARWHQMEQRLEGLVALQRELLDAGAHVVEPGGLLIYATCSLEPEENEGQVEAFLERHADYRRELPRPEPRLPDGVRSAAGDLMIHPWRYGSDGAYAARLRRREAA